MLIAHYPQMLCMSHGSNYNSPNLLSQDLAQTKFSNIHTVFIQDVVLRSTKGQPYRYTKKVN